MPASNGLAQAQALRMRGPALTDPPGDVEGMNVNKTPRILDANCGLGHVPGKSGSARTAGDLLRIMDRLGIAAALVHSTEAVRGNWPYGNARLMREIRGRGRLIPCWVVAPDVLAGPRPAELVATMAAAGVRAVRLCPRSQRHSLTPLVCGPLLDCLAAARLPVILDFEIYGWNETPDWAAVAELASRWPTLSFILPGCVLAASRNMVPHLQRYPNLYLDIGAYQEVGGIAAFIRAFGGHRAVWGSAFPHRGHEIALGLLQGRQLGPRARAAIGAANLAALMEGRVPRPIPAEPPAVARKLPLAAIDVHMHLGCDLAGTAEFTADQAVAALDAWGMQCGVASHLAALSGDVAEGNDALLDACRRHPGRLYGWAFFDAAQPERSAASCRRLLRHRAIVGFKVHQGTDERKLDDPGYEAMFQMANALSLPILAHENSHDGFETTLQKIARRWPRVRILHAHHGGTTDAPAAQQMARRLQRFPNLWLETSTSFAPPDAVGHLVRAGGGQRLCYGTDLGFMDNDGQTGKVLFADLTRKQLADVLRNNALKLIPRLSGQAPRHRRAPHH